MPEYCDHCNRQIGPDGCWPFEEDQDCWELRQASTSESVMCEVWVTKDSELPDSAARFLATLDQIEADHA